MILIVNTQINKQIDKQKQKLNFVCNINKKRYKRYNLCQRTYVGFTICLRISLSFPSVWTVLRVLLLYHIKCVEERVYDLWDQDTKGIVDSFSQITPSGRSHLSCDEDTQAVPGKSSHCEELKLPASSLMTVSHLRSRPSSLSQALEK